MLVHPRPSAVELAGEERVVDFGALYDGWEKEVSACIGAKNQVLSFETDPLTGECQQVLKFDGQPRKRLNQPDHIMSFYHKLVGQVLAKVGDLSDAARWLLEGHEEGNTICHLSMMHRSSGLGAFVYQLPETKMLIVQSGTTLGYEEPGNYSDNRLLHPGVGYGLRGGTLFGSGKGNRVAFMLSMVETKTTLPPM
ncbi:MAG: hypothetical protein AAF413_01750 [Patescibacteria group bacterium]